MTAEDRRDLVQRTHDFIEESVNPTEAASSMEVAALLSRLGDPATLVDREVSRLAVERGEAVATSAARSGRFRRRTGQASWHYPKLAGSREVQVRLFNGAKSDLVGEPRSATDAPKLTVPKQPGAAANGGDSDTAAGSAGESAESAVGVSPPVSGPQPASGPQPRASEPSDREPSDPEPGAAESGTPATEPGADLSPPTLPGPEANAGGADAPAGAKVVAGGAIASAGAVASAGMVAGAEAVASAGGSEPDASMAAPEPDAAVAAPGPDAGASVPEPEAGVAAPEPDAGVAAPEPDAGASAPEPDADASAPEAGVAAAEPDAARAAGPAADSLSAGETPGPAARPTEPDTSAAGTSAVPRTAASRAWRRATPRRGAAADPVGGAGPASATRPVPSASSGEREDPSSTARPWWPFVVARTSPEPAAAVMGAEPAVGRSVVAQRAAELAAACVRLARRHPLEAMAVILLGVGGAAYPPIWIIGAAIAGGSRFWDYRDKWVALLGPVLLLIVATTLAVSLGRTQTSFGSYVHESWVYADLISRGLALLSALYLVRRLSRGKRPAVKPPWERTHKIN
jgi:hypothetical protein